MAAPGRALVRPFAHPTKPNILPLQQCRHESSARRHKKLLNLPASPSYVADRQAPTLVFNPPSSSPSVYHTPLKFLPRKDVRKQLYATALQAAAQSALRTSKSSVSPPGTPLSTSSALPPRSTTPLPSPVRTPYEKKYHLTEADIKEIRRLRLSDPNTWTRVKLAEKFGCSQFFVGMIAKSPGKAEKVEAEHEAARNQWGARRRNAREERGRRKDMWGRDE